MNSKELVRNMIAFLNERHDMDCVTLRQRFAVCYGMSEDEAKKVIFGADNASDICRKFWC